MAKNWSQNLNKGALHRALNVPEGENIPAGKMASARKRAKKRPGSHLAKMVRATRGLATMRKMK